MSSDRINLRDMPSPPRAEGRVILKPGKQTCPACHHEELTCSLLELDCGVGSVMLSVTIKCDSCHFRTSVADIALCSSPPYPIILVELPYELMGFNWEA